MQRRTVLALLCVVMAAFAISGCDKDDKNANGIMVQGIDGNIVDNGIDVEGLGPDGQYHDSGDVQIALDGDSSGMGPGSEVAEDNVADGPGAGPGADVSVGGPSSPAEDASLGEDEGVVTSNAAPGGGPGAEVESTENTTGPIGTPEGALEVTTDPGAPSTGNAMDVTGPEGANATELPSFSAGNVSASGVVASAGKYVSLGAGDVAPDGSKVWSASSGSYSADIQADANGMIYSAFFSSSNGDKSFIADCAGAFDGGAQAFVNSNADGSYEANGMVFELEAKGEEMCSLRVVSKSYQGVLGSPQ